ncbi:helix-hairpin-helix domain-containing protein [Streptomyces sp. NPDC014802]|uniref:helix-hairpin-helix domain-containing protein n=1 Tax=Streptomyces sp. NPDC014802 TaxID=3364917 RepID=UPI0036FE463D
MALRSRTRSVHATSGPGRGLTSDGRVRHRRPASRIRDRRRQALAEELHRRAETLFGQGGAGGRESGVLSGSGGSSASPGSQGSRGSPGSLGLSGSPGEAVARAPDGRRVDAGDGGAHGPHVEVESKAAEDSPVEDDVAERAGGRRRWWVGPAVRERMPVWLQARCGVERRGVVALTVLLVVAAALAVQHFWTGRTETVSAPEVVRAAAPRIEEAPTPDSRDASGVPGPATTAAAGIVVDVSGKVREPGIHRLPAGSRVADALRAAGGVRPGADLHGLNRARFLVDGEQVVVGEPAPVAGAGAGGTGLGGPVGGAPGAPGAAPVAPVSLNTATVDQLDALPGVGPVLARHIVDYRTQHGGFRSVDELREVNGIGDRRFADLRELVRP